MAQESDQNQANIVQLDDDQQRQLIRIGKSPKANQRLRIPKRFVGKSLENFNDNADVISASLASIDIGNGVFITGKCGTGKTHLAIGLMLHWWADKWPDVHMAPLFIPSVEFFLELKSTFDNNQSEREVVQRYTDAPLLVFDDLGAERISDWSRQQFSLIIDRRYRDMRPIILTSNLSLDDIAVKLDDRIASRLVEMGAIVELTGSDHRI